MNESGSEVESFQNQQVNAVGVDAVGESVAQAVECREWHNLPRERKSMACDEYKSSHANGKDAGVRSFEQNDLSHVRHVIGVVSGKGGVGKSMVTGILATELARAGMSVGILDADITGPSIPRMFGLGHGQVTALGDLMLPPVTSTGIKVMSANLILPDESDPVLWRGPVLAGAIRQFWSDTSWGPLDCLLVDMPPGTGDVALTVFQSLPVDGIVIVTSPQDLVSMVVGKAVKMAQQMDVPILGLVENMSYAVCPDCGRHIEVFGPSHVGECAAKYGLEVLGTLPINPALADAADHGRIEEALEGGVLGDALSRVRELVDDADDKSQG